MELEHLGGGGGKPEKNNSRFYKIALAICVCVCAVLLLALIVGKSHLRPRTRVRPCSSHTGGTGVSEVCIEGGTGVSQGPCGGYFWGV